MGVKGLWGLLAPHARCEPLYKLKGEKIAIDLSGWICDSQSFAEQHAQPRLYLRNLYFRASYLILSEITPVFVLEGEAPKLKHDTMANRNLIQQQNFPKSSTNSKKKLRKPCTQRKRFKSVLAQCEILLKSMGLECVRGIGEAEAMCAHLNSTGAVSAVISQDSDCFAYGARRVYKNFSVSNSGSSATNSGSVEVYDMNTIQISFDFGQNKMVALALLCGSDYNGNGIEGVGHSTAVSLLQNFSDDTILDRCGFDFILFRSWISNPDMFENFAKTIDDTKYCTGCGHHGNIRSHNRIGCKDCKTSIGCDQSNYRNHYQNLKTELNIRNKVLKNSDGFPNDDLINEYLINKEVTPKNFNPVWHKPNLIKFVKLMCHKLKWTEVYCIGKFLPLMTKWQLLYKAKDHIEIDLFLGADPHNNQNWLSPLYIKKKRNLKGIPCYEIIWKDVDGHYEELIPCEQLKEINEEELWTTTEQQDLVYAAYPDLVEKFLSSCKSKKKTKSKKNHEENNLKITDFLQKIESKNENKLLMLNTEIENLNTSMNNLSIQHNVKNKVRKRKLVPFELSFKTKPRKYKKKSALKINVSQKKIDSFIDSKIVDVEDNMLGVHGFDSHINSIPSVYDSFINLKKQESIFQLSHDISITALNKYDDNITNDDVDDDDISFVINKIVNRNDNCYENFLKSNHSSPLRNVKSFSTPVKMSSVSKNRNAAQQHLNSSPMCSSFFEHLKKKSDAFETSFFKYNIDDKYKLKHFGGKISWTKIYNSLNNSNEVSFQY